MKTVKLLESINSQIIIEFKSMKSSYNIQKVSNFNLTRFGRNCYRRMVLLVVPRLQAAHMTDVCLTLFEEIVNDANIYCPSIAGV